MINFPKIMTCIALGVILSFNSFSCVIGRRPEKEPSAETTEEQLTAIDPPPNGYIFENLLSTTAYYASVSLTIEVGEAKGYYIVLDPISLDYGEGSYEEYKAQLDAKYSYIKVYVNRYSSVELLVPPGEYKVYWAEGQVWYGEENLFGEDTIYYKGSATETIKTSSYRLELKKHGNVIRKDEFPK